MKHTKKFKQLLPILSLALLGFSFVAGVKIPEISQSKLGQISRQNSATSASNRYSEENLAVVQDAYFVGPDQIKIPLNKYGASDKLKDVLLTEDQINFYDQIAGYITPWMDVQGSVDWAKLGDYEVTLSGAGLNKNHVSKKITVSIINPSDEVLNAGTTYTTGIIQNFWLHFNAGLDAGVRQSYDLITKTILLPGDKIEIKQTNHKYTEYITPYHNETKKYNNRRDDSIFEQFSVRPYVNNGAVGIYFTKDIKSNPLKADFINSKNVEASKQADGSIVFGIPNVKADLASKMSDLDGNQLEVAKNNAYTIMVRSPKIINKDPSYLPVYEWKITRTNSSSQPFKKLLYVHIHDENFAEKYNNLAEVKAWNRKNFLAFRNRWKDDDSLLGGVVLTNGSMIVLPYLERKNMIDITESSTNWYLTLYKEHAQNIFSYAKMAGFDTDNPADPNNREWNIRSAARPLMVTSGVKKAGGYASGEFIASFGLEISHIYQGVLYHHELAHLFQGVYRFSTPLDLTEVSNMVVATFANLQNQDVTKVTNELFMGNYRGSKGGNSRTDSWDALMHFQEQYIATNQNDTYRSLYQYSELAPVPFFKMFRLAGLEAWYKTNKFYRELNGFVKNDPVHTNPEKDWTKEAAEALKAKRLSEFHAKYPELSDTPNFWDVLAFFSAQELKIDFSHYLSLWDINLDPKILRSIQQTPGVKTAYQAQEMIHNQQDWKAILDQKIPNLNNKTDLLTLETVKNFNIDLLPGNLKITLVYPYDDKDWLIGKMVKVYKQGVLVGAERIPANLQINFTNLDAGLYDLVFPQKIENSVSVSLSRKTVFIPPGIGVTEIYPYTKPNLKNALSSMIDITNQSRSPKAFIAEYYPNRKQIYINSRLSTPHGYFRDLVYYGLIVRDKTTDFFTEITAGGETSRVLTGGNLFKVVNGYVDRDGEQNTYSVTFDLDPIKLANDQYEIWSLTAEYDRLFYRNDFLNGRIDGVTLYENTPQKNDAINWQTRSSPDKKGRGIAVQDYFKDLTNLGGNVVLQRWKLDQDMGILPGNELFLNNFDLNTALKAATSSTKPLDPLSTLPQIHDSWLLEKAKSLEKEITSNRYNVDTLNDLAYQLESIINLFSDEWKAVSANATIFNNWKAIIAQAREIKIEILERSKLIVKQNQQFNPLKGIEIVDSENGTLDNNLTKLVATDLRIDENGKYYAPFEGIYHYEFSITNSSNQTKTYKRNIFVDDSGTQSSIADKNKHIKNHESLNQNNYGIDDTVNLKEVSNYKYYKNRSKIRPIKLSDGLITSYKNLLQKRDFNGNVLWSVNLFKNENHNFLEKLILSNTQTKAYAMVTESTDYITLSSALLEIDLATGKITKTIDLPDGINSFAMLNDETVLVWEMQYSINENNQNLHHYTINLKDNSIKNVQISGKEMNLKSSYLINVMQYQGTYRYKKLGYNNFGQITSFEETEVSYENPYIGFFLSGEEASIRFAILDHNFNQVTKPVYVELKPNSIPTDFTVNQASYPISPTTYGYLAGGKGGQRKYLSEYASQLIKPLGNNKFLFGDVNFPVLDAKKEDKSPALRLNVFDVNHADLWNITQTWNASTNEFDPTRNTGAKPWILGANARELDSNFYANEGFKIEEFKRFEAISDVIDFNIEKNQILALTTLQFNDSYQNKNEFNKPVVADDKDVDYSVVLVTPSRRPKTTEVQKVFNYKGLVAGDLNLSNLNANLTKIDQNNYLITFMNSQKMIKFSLNDDGTLKSKKLISIHDANVGYSTAILNKNQFASAVSDSEKKKIEDQIKNELKTDVNFEWVADDQKGDLVLKYKWNQNNWINNEFKQVNQTIIFDHFYTEANAVQFLNPTNQTVQNLLQNFASDLTIDQVKNSILVFLNDEVKNSAKVSLVPNDASGELTIHVEAQLGAKKLNLTQKYEKLPIKNQDLNWAPNLSLSNKEYDQITDDDLKTLFNKKNDDLVVQKINKSLDSEKNRLNLILEGEINNKKVQYSTSYQLKNTNDPGVVDHPTEEKPTDNNTIPPGIPEESKPIENTPTVSDGSDNSKTNNTNSNDLENNSNSNNTNSQTNSSQKENETNSKQSTGWQVILGSTLGAILGVSGVFLLAFKKIKSKKLTSFLKRKK